LPVEQLPSFRVDHDALSVPEAAPVVVNSPAMVYLVPLVSLNRSRNPIPSSAFSFHVTPSPNGDIEYETRPWVHLRL